MAGDQSSCSRHASGSNGPPRRCRPRFKRILFLAASLILLLLLGQWLFAPRLGPEPEVNGVPIRKWLATEAGLEGPYGAHFAKVAVCGTNAIPWLVEALKAKDSRLQPLILKLRRHLPTALKDRWSPPRRSEEIREIAWQSLRFYGEEARPWLSPILAAAKQETGWRGRPSSVPALLTVGGETPEVVDFLRERLAGPESSPKLQDEVTGAFYQVGWSPPPLHPLVISLLQARLSTETNGSAACNTLPAVSTAMPEAASTIPVLMEVLKDGMPCPGNVWRAFQNLGPAAGPVVPLLRERLRTGDALGRAVAADILWRIGPLANEAFQELEAAMSDPDAGVRAVAAGAWGRLGGEPGTAVAVLEEACLTDLYTRRAARYAIQAIREATAP